MNNNSNNQINGRLEDREYYNDLPGKIPPDLPFADSSDKNSKEISTLQRLPTAAPRSAIKKSLPSSGEQNGPNLIDLNVDLHDEAEAKSSVPLMDTSGEQKRSEPQYVNCSTEESTSNQIKTNDSQTGQTVKDPFDMRKRFWGIVVLIDD